MGLLAIPSSGSVYADAPVAIYTVDNHPVYAAVCRPLWEAVKAGSVTAVSSELTLLETLVGPIRQGDAARAAIREALWQQTNTELLPITKTILREAARLRAELPALKTPDAIHAATAMLHGCVLFVTNDRDLARVSSLPLAILDDVVAAP